MSEKRTIIYEWHTTRNKNGKGNSPSQIKKELFDYYGIEDWKQMRFELEHKIPISLTGHIFDKSNLELMDKHKHQEKTGFDKKVVEFLKKTEIIRKLGDNGFMSPIEPSRIRELYIILYNLFDEARGSWQDYDIYYPDPKYKLYKIVHYTKNKEVENDIKA